MAKKTTTTTATASRPYCAAEDRGETIYKIWLAEDRRAKEGYDLVVYANFRKEFLSEKLVGNKTIDDYDQGKEFVLELAKEKELGTYFHNPRGVAYGAAKRKPNGDLEILHGEYWLNGKRIIEESEIKRLIHNKFSETANSIINSKD